MNRCQIITGDCRQALKELPSGSVHTCVTSPPFWRLRSYLDNDDPLKPLEIGQERTPEEYVATMVQVFREVKRVLRDDGTLWLNLGSTYWGGNRGGNPEESEFRKQATNQGSLLEPPDWTPHPVFKPKDLVPIPWMVGMALQKDGWWLRAENIWAKKNCMPESCTDRPTKSHEQVLLLAKSQHYFYDNEAVKVPASDSYANDSRWDSGGTEMNYKDGYAEAMAQNPKMPHRVFNGERRNMVNLRDVWHVTLQPYSESHFAVFPEDLIKPCILAGTSAKGCCPKCGAPWERVLDSEQFKVSDSPRSSGNGDRNDAEDGRFQTVSKTVGWRPTCDCYLCADDIHAAPCTVLDPFGGSGTTGQVALELGRKAILIELNPRYVTLIENRTHVTPGLPLA